ncbi:MAG TPA: ATP-binding protein [Bryobacteraceae bacterium]
MLRYIRVCLRRIPLELPPKTIHARKLYQRRNDFVGVSGRARQLVIAIRNIEQDWLEVTVEDSGPGEDPDKIGGIFQPFYTSKSGGMLRASPVAVNQLRVWSPHT